MPYLGGMISLVFQVFFAVHAARTGRQNWIFIILMVPGLGCLIYFFAEYLPSLQASPAVRMAGAGLKKTINPKKAIREYTRRLEISDNLQNRENLARAFYDNKQYREAIDVLEPYLQGPYSQDPHILEGLACAYYALKEFDPALEYLLKLKKVKDDGLGHNSHLLLARTYEALEQIDLAVKELEALRGTFPGEEARCRYGILLKRIGRNDEAQAVFDEMKADFKLSEKYYKNSQRKWFKLAEASSR